MDAYIFSLSCYKYKWSPWQIINYDFLYTHFCQPVDLSTCRPVYRVDLSTLSIRLPCQPVYLVNLSTCILSTLQPIYQFNIHNIIHYIGRININLIFKVKSPRTSFYRILDLSQKKNKQLSTKLNVVTDNYL